MTQAELEAFLAVVRCKIVLRFVSMSDASLRKNILSGFPNVLYFTLPVYATYLSAVLSCFSFIVTANGEIL